MAIPVILDRSVQRVGPIMGVTLFLCCKGVIEDGIKIDQLIKRAIRANLFADGIVFAYEIAIYLIFAHYLAIYARKYNIQTICNSIQI